MCYKIIAPVIFQYHSTISHLQVKMRPLSILFPALLIYLVSTSFGLPTEGERLVKIKVVLRRCGASVEAFEDVPPAEAGKDIAALQILNRGLAGKRGLNDDLEQASTNIERYHRFIDYGGILGDHLALAASVLSAHSTMERMYLPTTVVDGYLHHNWWKLDAARKSYNEYLASYRSWVNMEKQFPRSTPTGRYNTVPELVSSSSSGSSSSATSRKSSRSRSRSRSRSSSRSSTSKGQKRGGSRKRQ